MFVDALDFDNTMEEYVGIRFYLSEEEDVTTILGEIKLRFPKYVFRQGKTDDEDWAHNWKNIINHLLLANVLLLSRFGKT